MTHTDDLEEAMTREEGNVEAAVTQVTAFVAYLLEGIGINTAAVGQHGDIDTSKMTHFCSHYLGFVVGNRPFQKRCLAERIRDIATLSDESVTILLIENGYLRWIQEYKWEQTHGRKKKKKGDQPQIPKATLVPNKYSLEGGGKMRMYGGWKLEGMTRMQQISTHVKARRLTRQWGKFEIEYIAQCSKNSKANHKKDAQEEVPFEVGQVGGDAYEDDLSDDDEERAAPVAALELIFADNVSLNERVRAGDRKGVTGEVTNETDL